MQTEEPRAEVPDDIPIAWLPYILRGAALLIALRKNYMRYSWLLLILINVFVGTAAQADDVPDLDKTPGSVRAGLTKEKICSIKWGRDERHVTSAMKRDVFKLYGYLGYDDPRCVPAGNRRCEIDHLISRELGGADEVKNLWPQAYGTSPWNAIRKDKLENRLHDEMCAGRVTLQEARHMLVYDWRKAYVKYYGQP